MPRFLVLRFSSIGDIVLTTPVIRCLKQQVKDAEVHYATRDVYAEVIVHNPYIDKIKLLGSDLSLFINELKKEKYDYIIDLHHNLRTMMIKTRLGTKSVSFNKLNFEKWLMVNFKINRLPAVHIVDRYMKTIQPFGVTNDGLGLDYFLSMKDETAVQQLPSSHQNGYIGFVIGAGHFTKQLPLEKIISVCKKINQPIVLLGGKEDHEKGEAIVRQLNSKPTKAGLAESVSENPKTDIYNGCGKFSINQSAALVKHARKIITHDTGLMHVAAAFKKEIISIWGNTIPEFGMTPYFGNQQVNHQKFEINNLRCRPCTKIGYDKCPKGHFKCMLQMDEQKIADAVAS